MSKRIAIIPARSGSKGVPDKNIKKILDKPLIAWSIEAALDSRIFDTVMVSTDSNKYKEIALEYGAEVPFLRSEENASDTSSSWDVVREVISGYQKNGLEYESICLLQPTSPFRDKLDIINAFKLFEEKTADSIISVCELDHPLDICNYLSEDWSMEGFFDSTKPSRRQDLKKAYRINGAIYIQKVDKLMNNQNIYGKKSYAYIMDKSHSIDIDTDLDFFVAECIAKHMR